MEIKKLPYRSTQAFSEFFLSYIEGREALKPFFSVPPTKAGITALMEPRKAFPKSSRLVLHTQLQHQYEGLTIKEAVKSNLAALKEPTTFTILTGHQLNIATGPLYFIFKIVTVINACRELKKAHPQHTFVPVYWMASEDHDYDEIKSFRLFGKSYSWQTNQTGAVGRFTTQGLAELMPEFSGVMEVFKEAYSKNKTLAAAVRYYVNSLFGEYGVVVVDGDDAGLKGLFREVMKSDILNQQIKPLVEETDKQIRELGFEPQIYCREINFFYLDGAVRSRIEKTANGYKVLDTNLVFSEAEIHQLIESNPEKFSPNVILRPLYQETILPNLAYVGGPAEMVYWLQLKSVFDHFKITFPALVPRNFGMILDHTILRKFAKTGLEEKDLFESKNYLFNTWVLRNSKRDLTVQTELDSIKQLFDQLVTKSETIDKTLSPYVAAMAKRSAHSIESIGAKMMRAEKKLHKDRLRQIEEVKDALFPGGGLQERKENFMNFGMNNPRFLEMLISTFDPFDFSFYLINLAENE